MGLGKWILGGLGWSIFGPIGGILGFLLGRSFENGNLLGSGSSDDQPSSHRAYQSSNTSGGGYHRYQNTGNSNDLSAALLVLMAAVMKADNVVKKSELDVVKRFLVSNYGEDTAKEMLLRLRDLQKDSIPLDSVCRQIKINTDYTTRYHMLDFLFTIADADGEVSTVELSVLRTIANNLGVRLTDLMSIMGRHMASGFGGGGYGSGSYGGGYSGRSTYNEPPKKDPYKVLGIERTATDDEVRKAYRRLAMKYHPDKVEGLGEDVKRNAEAQFREINEAYETIKNERGMK